MLRLRPSPLFLIALGACSRPDPEPLSSYRPSELSIMRGLDGDATEIVYLYLPPSDTEECPPLDRVEARIDGRSLAVNAGGSSGTYCFGASFKTPLVVLRRDADEHELVISGDGKTVRALATDLASSARLVATEGSPVSLTLSEKIRGRPIRARATWSANVSATTFIDGDRVIVELPERVRQSARAVLDVHVTYALDVTSCEGVTSCRASWLVHEVFDLPTAR